MNSLIKPHIRFNKIIYTAVNVIEVIDFDRQTDCVTCERKNSRIRIYDVAEFDLISPCLPKLDLVLISR